MHNRTIFLVAISLFFPGAIAQCTPDQVQDLWNGGTSERNLPGYYEWQSFTAGSSGVLCQVDLMFCNLSGPVTGSGVLNVHRGEGITGTLLATQPVTVDGSAFAPNQPFWATWTLSNAPDVQVDSLYTFQFVPTQGGGLPDPYLIQILLPGTYAGGINHNLGVQGDCTFRTHVAPSGVGMPETQRPSLSVYPNPSSGLLTVRTPLGGETLVLRNAQGLLIGRWQVPGPYFLLDLTPFATGPYHLELHTSTASVHTLVMKD
jgi:hypothetical protein